ncbi:DUF2691 family protein [Cytobacillus solani]|uniref:Prophage protein n=1 Tax=Cytobacillus solani TaxID=1637975 RepID=A0A0Q3QW03_9BACI|nr:DUF2691 family protein [Cytobacillus solani]KOP83866.1 hypothetical protein AMS60_00685 [Bacillus sp. FJAT-21945]KQL21808.1 hypothetical protein AN957_05870 [Cytobacillus solani]
MKRGISFEIPNKYGNFLGKILKPIEMSKLNWHVENVESYLVVKDQLADELFPQQLNGMAGMGLRDYLENNTYYLIFADLKAFPSGESLRNVETYEEFVNSKCQLVLLIVDSAYVTIYCKEKEDIESLYQNAKSLGFENIQYITDDHDTRTRLSVW